MAFINASRKMDLVRQRQSLLRLSVYVERRIVERRAIIEF